MEQEIERSLLRAVDLLQKTKFQEGTAQSLPEEQHPVVAAFKKELENHQAALGELVRQQLRACDFERRVEAALEKLRGDFDTAQQLQAMEAASVRVEWEQHRAQWSALEAAVSKMQEEVSVQGSQSAQVEGLVRDIRGNVDSLREDARQWMQSSDEFKTLHQDVVRSTSSLTQVIEDVSAAAAATERSLRQEMEETRLSLERANAEQRAEISKDQQDLRLFIENICKDVANLQAVAVDNCNAHASAAGKVEQASHCVQEVLATAGDRLGRLEASLKRLELAEANRPASTAGNGAEGGVATAQDIHDIWDVLSMLKASLEARESAVRAEADARSLQAESEQTVGCALASRVAALEEQSRTQKNATVRVGALVESLELLLGECAAVGRDGEASADRPESGTFRASIATPRPSEVAGCRTPLTDLSVCGSVKGDLLRTVKACASAALGGEETGCAAALPAAVLADPFRTPDLTPAAVARLPTPQAPGTSTVSPPTKECIRV